MGRLLLVVLAAVEIGGSFGLATATVEAISDSSMTIDIEVEVKTSAQAVVAHLAFEDEPTVTLPLLGRGGGVFGIRTELEPKNYLVVFEAVGDPDGLSDPVSLEDLGADLDTGGDDTSSGGEGDDGISDETKRLGWLALALAAGSLSALAFWALGDRGKAEGSDEEEE